MGEKETITLPKFSEVMREIHHYFRGNAPDADKSALAERQAGEMRIKYAADYTLTAELLKAGVSPEVFGDKEFFKSVTTAKAVLEMAKLDTKELDTVIEAAVQALQKNIMKGTAGKRSI